MTGVQITDSSPEETELIERIAVLPVKDALTEVLNGRINDVESAMAIMLALARPALPKM